MPKAKLPAAARAPAATPPPVPAGPPASALPPAAALSAFGPRRATINDIARLANVSKKTVSRVINQSPFVKDETRARIDAVIQEIGYAPDPQARGLAFRRSFLIGMVYDNPNAQYIVNIQDGALDALRGSGFELVVHPCDRCSDDFIPGVRRFVERQKLHGVILIPPVSENDELVRTLHQTDCQYVRVASVCAENTGRMIVSNDFEATAEVAEHLASLGHRRIGVIAGPSRHRSSHERLRGFVGALEKRGITVPPDLIIEGAFTFESGVTCAEALLRLRQRPTAIFACNDEMAAGVYKAAFALRVSIPDELSVVGFDDSPMASRLTPALTTVRIPIRDMGRLAAARLISPRVTDEGPARMTLHLIVRDSSRPPR